jgi:hypothetical protein
LEAEIAALEAAAPIPGRRLFVRFAWRTGVRVSEMERANIENVGTDSHGPVPLYVWGSPPGVSLHLESRAT